MPLVECYLLDPRPVTEADARRIAGAVNIPWTEIPQRTHELPPRGETIAVAGPSPAAEQAVSWLTGNGRQAVVQREFSYTPAPCVAMVGRLWRPHAFLVEILPRLSPGRALDLACGAGREAVFAAACGWSVTAIDVLPDALERARQLAQHCAAAITPIEWRQADLQRDPPALAAEFDLVFAFRYLHRPLVPRLAEWLKPGGSLVYETFTTLHRERHGKPQRDEHVLQLGELPALLAGLEIRHFSEAWRGNDHTARVWAAKP
jgi:SAM-dependent methyltransferase